MMSFFYVLPFDSLNQCLFEKAWKKQTPNTQAYHTELVFPSLLHKEVLAILHYKSHYLNSINK